MMLASERNVFRIVVALAACPAIFAGLSGALSGACAFDRAGCAGLDPFLRSHVHYLSGLLAAIGLSYWWTLRRPEAQSVAYRLLTAIVLIGGLARLVGLALDASSDPGVWISLALELVVAPAVCIWQARIARTG